MQESGRRPLWGLLIFFHSTHRLRAGLMNGTPASRAHLCLFGCTHLRPIEFASPAATLPFFFVQMLGQVVFDAHFADGVQLGFEPVDVLFFVGQDAFQQVAGAVIANLDT